MRRLGLFLLCLLASTVFAGGATKTWTGANSNNWSDNGNWNEGSAPISGDLIIFNASSNRLMSGVMNISSLSVLSITIAADVPGDVSISLAQSLTIQTGGIILNPNFGLNITGSGSLLIGGALSFTNNGTGMFDIGVPITMSTPSLTIAGSGDTTITGIISGTGGGSLIKSGLGKLRLDATNSYDGLTDIQAGSVVLTNGAGLGAESGGTQVADGATLKFLGGGVSVGNETLMLNGSGVGGLGLGALVTDGGSNVWAGPIQLNSSTTIGNASGGLLISGVISGSGALTKVSTGTLMLSGTNVYTGVTTISAGILEVRNNDALGVGGIGTTVSDGAAVALGNNVDVPESFTLNGAGLGSNGALYSVTGSNVVNGTVTLLSSASIGAEASTFLSLYGIVSGGVSQTLTKIGAGTVELVVANTYSGNTVVSNGLLLVASAATLGDATGNTTVQAGASLEFYTGGDGNIVVNEPLILNGNGFLGSGGLILSPSFSDTATFDAPINLASSTLVFLNTNNAVYINGVISGAAGAGLNVNGNLSSRLIIGGTAANTYPGPTVLILGKVEFTKPAGVVAIPGDLTLGDGIIFIDIQILAAEQIADTSSVTITNFARLYLSEQNETIGALSGDGELRFDQVPPSAQEGGLASNPGPNTFTIAGSSNTLFDGDITGDDTTDTLVKDGTGKLVLNGPQLYFSKTIVRNGTLKIVHAGALGDPAGSGTEVEVNGTLALQGGVTVSTEYLVLAGTLLNNGGFTAWRGDITLIGAAKIGTGGNGDKLEISSFIDGAGGVTIGNGTGTLLFNGGLNNTYTGETIVNSGTLELSTSSNTNLIPGKLTIGNGTSAAAVTLFNSSLIIDTSAVTINANATFNLTDGTNDFFERVGSLSGAGTVALGNNLANTLHFGDAANTTFSGVFSGTQAADNIGKYGTGTTTLTGNSSFAGEVQISAGVLSAQQANALGVPGGNVYVLNNATLEVAAGTALAAKGLHLNGFGAGGTGALRGGAGANSVDGTVDLQSNVLIGETTTGSLSIKALIDGVVDIAISAGAGKISFGNANKYTGTTTVNSGLLEITNALSLGTSAKGTLVIPGASLQVSGGFSVIGEALTLNGNGAGNGALINGAGNNTFSGPVTLSASSAIGVQVATDTLTLLGVIDGAAGKSLEKVGPGLLFLGGASTYAGGSTVFAGTLKTTNIAGSATGSGPVGVNSGATLIVRGPIASAVTVNNSGTLVGAGIVTNSVTMGDGSILTVGESGIGRLESGPLSLDAGTTLNVDLGTRGTGDIVVVNGDLLLKGTLVVSDAGGFNAGVHDLIQYSGLLNPAPLPANPMTINSLPGGLNGIVGNPAAGRVSLLAGATLAPVLTGFTISQSQSSVVTSTPASYQANITDPNDLGLTFTWDFGDATPIQTTNPADHSYASEATFNINFTANNGFASTSGSLSVKTLAPNSGGQGIPNISDGAPPVVNPLTGISTRVVSSNGGIITLEINLAGLITKRDFDGFSVNTDFDGIGGRLSSQEGLKPVQKFTEPGVFVATSKAVEIAVDRDAGKARKTLVVSDQETGKPTKFKTLPVKRKIILKSFTGRFNFGTPDGATAPKDDSIVLKGRIELPEGLDISKKQTVSLGVGNIVDQAEVDAKGKQVGAAALKRAKTVKVKMPKLPKGKVETTPGLMADVEITIKMPDMSANGFDTEGIVPQLTPAEEKAKGKFVKRNIQTAVVIGGVSYEAEIPVEFKLSKNKAAGAITGRSGSDGE